MCGFMTTLSTRLLKLVNAKKVGLAALAVCFAIQSLYGLIKCDSGVATFWLATLVAQIPAVAWLANRNQYPAAVAAAVIIQLFCLWANSMECKPYAGGGASMAYVVVFLYGWPTSTVLALLSTKIAKQPSGN
jgi:hypothetical protein